MGVWCDSLRNQQSEKTGAVRVCRNEGGVRCCTMLTQLVLRRFGCVLDSGLLMGVRYEAHSIGEASVPSCPSHRRGLGTLPFRREVLPEVGDAEGRRTLRRKPGLEVGCRGASCSPDNSRISSPPVDAPDNPDERPLLGRIRPRGDPSCF